MRLCWCIAVLEEVELAKLSLTSKRVSILVEYEELRA